MMYPSSAYYHGSRRSTTRLLKERKDKGMTNNTIITYKGSDVILDFDPRCDVCNGYRAVLGCCDNTIIA
jgi:hypothetical protein